jgi:hypothetical protein
MEGNSGDLESDLAIVAGRASDDVSDPFKVQAFEFTGGWPFTSFDVVEVA